MKLSDIARLFEELRRVTIASGGVWQAEIDSHLIYPCIETGSRIEIVFKDLATAARIRSHDLSFAHS